MKSLLSYTSKEEECNNSCIEPTCPCPHHIVYVYKDGALVDKVRRQNGITTQSSSQV